MTIQLRTDQVDILIDEQRRLLRSGDYSKDTCFHNMGYLKQKYNESAYGNKTYLNTKFLKQTKQCSICFENHEFNKLLKTDCGHYFGICCYSRWEKSLKKNQVTCPYCRKLNPEVTLFAENNLQYVNKIIKN